MLRGGVFTSDWMIMQGGTNLRELNVDLFATIYPPDLPTELD